MQNINGQQTNVILGKTMNRLYGEEYIHDKMDDLTFAISAKSFYQINPEQTEVLYKKTMEYADIGDEDIVIDAYCGTGNLSLIIAHQAKNIHDFKIVSLTNNNSNQKDK